MGHLTMLNEHEIILPFEEGHKNIGTAMYPFFVIVIKNL
jgi:hypothetical protein